eukprot:TRINITY_DN692_c3_g1_i1.p1 TRINITY_DN692_c3_g1~~TRINITY_DN692_c3_g1_i1.p1  ORF type:complete len:237 (+),score=52.38 TRINITY_DN692_c3_g1_i1:221-931(+)
MHGKLAFTTADKILYASCMAKLTRGIEFGSELVFSIAEMSPGLAAGLSWTSRPRVSGASAPVLPPKGSYAVHPLPSQATATLGYLGNIDLAYSAQLTPRLAMATRWTGNVFSYAATSSAAVRYLVPASLTGSLATVLRARVTSDKAASLSISLLFPPFSHSHTTTTTPPTSSTTAPTTSTKTTTISTTTTAPTTTTTTTSARKWSDRGVGGGESVCSVSVHYDPTRGPTVGFHFAL